MSGSANECAPRAPGFELPPQRWSSRSLHAKALALFAALTALLATEIILVVRVFADVEQHFEEFAELDAQRQQLVVGVIQVRDLLLDVDLATTSEDQRAILEHWDADLEALRTITPDLVERLGPEAMALVSALQRRSRELMALPDPIEEAVGILGKDIRVNLQEYGNILIAHTAQIQSEVGEVTEHASRHRRTFILIIGGMGVLGLIVLGVAGGSFLTRLLHTLRSLSQQARRIAAGDYGQANAASRDDEIGEVIRSMDAMSADLVAREQELARMRDRFGQLERMFAMGVLGAQMAHELGNPIQAIMALSLHASDSLREDQSRENVLANLTHLDLIAEHVERLTRTVSDIREIGRPARPETDILDLNEIVRSTVRLMRFERRFSRADVQLELGNDIPAVRAVADHIAQVLVNLLINAADVVPERGGSIAVRTTFDGQWVAIHVSDNGEGMEDAVKTLVFEPFFSTKLKENGTGLGLTICKKIIEDHGGRIVIDSTAGEGTTVTVMLPKG